MPRVQDEADDPTPLRANLRMLIAAESVNAWAARHKLVQTTINRILKDGMQPTTKGVAEIAEAIGVAPWQMLAPGLGLGLYRLRDDRQFEPVYRAEAQAVAAAPAPPARSGKVRILNFEEVPKPETVEGLKKPAGKSKVRYRNNTGDN